MKHWIVNGVLLVIVAGAAADMLLAGAATTLRLRRAVRVSQLPIVMADVLDFSRAAPELVEAIADEPLVSGPLERSRITITHEEILARLDKLGVNPAEVLVQGALACEVALAPTRQPTNRRLLQDKRETRPAHLLSFQGANAGQTLAELITQRLREEFARYGGDVELGFERASAAYVELTSPPYEFSLRGLGRRTLGVRELHVTIERDGELQRSAPLYVDVKLVREVAVAKRPLNVGTHVAPEDVALERRVFDRIDDIGIDDLGEAIGQRVKAYVPAGEMVHSDDLKPVDLVLQSRPVTVLGGSGAITARVTGYAMDSGGFGDSVRVRLGEARRNRREARATVVGVGTVRLESDAYAAKGQ